MSISILKLNLRSKNMIKSFSFFSFLFDAEIEVDQQGLQYIELSSIKIYFDEKCKNNLKEPLFSLSIDNRDDFLNFKNKLSLAFYKEGVKSKINLDTPESIEFKDLDGNPWRVELEQSSSLTNVDSLTQNVRNF